MIARVPGSATPRPGRAAWASMIAAETEVPARRPVFLAKAGLRPPMRAPGGEVARELGELARKVGIERLEESWGRRGVGGAEPLVAGHAGAADARAGHRLDDEVPRLEESRGGGGHARSFSEGFHHFAWSHSLEVVPPKRESQLSPRARASVLMAFASAMAPWCFQSLAKAWGSDGEVGALAEPTARGSTGSAVQAVKSTPIPATRSPDEAPAEASASTIASVAAVR